MPLDVLQDALQLELGLEDHRHSTLHRQAHHDGQPVDVEERHDRHRDVLAVAEVREPRTALQGVGDKRAVREHRAFRHAGRAAGVLKDRDVVGARAGVEPIGRGRKHLIHGERAGIAREVLAVAVLLFLREREEEPHDLRHLLLDVRDDHVLDGCRGRGPWARSDRARGFDDRVET